ncbi:type VI secretion system lipoprotein TssJ [Corallococcus sp. CA053C]|uniref:type VI secretion system lipoprotein TssJ n=1 Tax=Corallococcus sp. CA053C TaxID=2316732 RepID=UPI001F242B61|nr:type VI secretion system lipoprotein TssJ [Corallococcus sp. CA053C]
MMRTLQSLSRAVTCPRWFFLIAAVLATGCVKRVAQQCETPPPFYVVLDVSEQVNPDPRGRSLPTVVRVIQLKDSARLERASFRDLWSRADELLKDDLLQSSEFVAAPGQTNQRWLQRDPKAHFVLTMGHFRQPLGYSWRTVAVLPPVPEAQCVERPAGGDLGPPKRGDQELRYRLQGYQIDLMLQPPVSSWAPEPSQQPSPGVTPEPRRGA